MVSPPPAQQASDPPQRKFRRARGRRGSDQESRTWLVPGETSWEVWSVNPSGESQRERHLGKDESLPDVDFVALPSTLITCQIFWLETTEEGVARDLLRMQCERRAVLREGQIWTHRILWTEKNRSLAQVLILQDTLPSFLEIDGAVHFEPLAHCFGLPPRSLAIWRTLDLICLALSNETDVVHFQSLPHRKLDAQCLGDLRAILWMATALKWTPPLERLCLVGDWKETSSSEIGEALGLSVERLSRDRLAPPPVAMELTPRKVTQLRIASKRRQRIRWIGVAIAILYSVFLGFQISSGLLTSLSNTKLESRLAAIMPRVLLMQNTARELDALNPALDVKTYPLEILYRVTAVLPEKGVRLTRFDIVGNRLEIAGESTTAREAFDYIRALETAESLHYVDWEEAPQPVPLPNDTTRFSIRGTIQGAYHDVEEP